MRVDPTDGTIVGQVALPDRGGRFGISTSDVSSFQGLRARMVLNAADESLYVTLPEAGSLSVVPTSLFPPLAQDIPWVETPDAPVFASIYERCEDGDAGEPGASSMVAIASDG